MRNTSFFEKLTGSLRLSDEDLATLDDPEEKKDSKQTDKQIIKSSKPSDDNFEIIEDDDDFEIPEDAEIEVIEEIIEDDTIDEEEVEEYYEEIIDEDDEDEISIDDEETNTSLANDDSEATESDQNDDYPVYHLSKDDKDDDSFENAKTEEAEKAKTIEQIQLPIDVFEMHNEVVLRILVPGITPENLKVSITRDHVSLTCTRPSPEGIKDSSYFDREIPYGDFTRMIHLPSDVDVEHAEAVEKYGLLIIRLPMLDAKKVQELKIKSV